MSIVESRNVEAVLAEVREHWSPRTIAVVNDYDVRVAKVRGEFTAHRHLTRGKAKANSANCLRSLNPRWIVALGRPFTVSDHRTSPDVS